jgi:dTDP-4-dehydrorhamnose reductase
MPFFSFELIDPSKPIVVFGRDGQIGKALQESFKGLAVPVFFLAHADCDLADEVSINQVLNRHQPQVIINAAAYTAVDKAESEPNLAFAINAFAPKMMAQYTARQPQGVFIHYSTDYVFADTKETAYTETDVTGPVDQLCIYGQSKLAGEQAITETFNLAQNKSARYFILRTSWVYGDGANFIKTIWNLAHSKENLRVVNDQIGIPTSAGWLAGVCECLLTKKINSGVYHTVPDGEISWFDLARLIVEYLQEHRASILTKKLMPISTKEYPTVAKRPYNSRLNNHKLKAAIPNLFCEPEFDWKHQVIKYLDQLNEKHN